MVMLLPVLWVPFAIYSADQSVPLFTQVDARLVHKLDISVEPQGVTHTEMLEPACIAVIKVCDEVHA